MDEDAFFLGWLARECRFQLSVHFAPKTRVGYRMERRVLVSPKDEPALNLWLASKGIGARILKDAERIHALIRLLLPVKEHVRDGANMLKMLRLMDHKGRFPTHAEIEELIDLIDQR